MTAAFAGLDPDTIAAARRPSSDGGDRVVIVTLNRTHGVTGVHAHTQSLSEGLRLAGIGCDIVTPFSGSRAWTPLFAVRPLLLKRFFPTRSTLWYRYWHAAALRSNLRTVLKQSPACRIVAQCPPSAQAAMDVRAELGLIGKLEITLVCHFNGSEADEYRTQGTLSGRAYDRVKSAEERTLREIDRVVYVSGWARDLVERQRGIRTKQSAVIWNGVAASTAATTAVKRADLGLADSDIVLMNIGTLESRKNQLGLLPLFARVAAQFDHARLLLVGDGPQRQEIENAARALGIDGKVKLLGHRRDVPALLAIADIYVHFADLENCPIVLLEAARAGLPWAAKPSGGVRELIDGLGGLALADDVDAAFETLANLMSSRSHRHAAGQRARQCFDRGFTQHAMVAAYAQALGLSHESRRQA